MRIVSSTLIGAVLLGAVQTGPARAQSAPSEFQQRFACMGDALRLCSQFVPDREKIRLCMAAQHNALSAGCRPVFDASMKALAAERAARP